MVAHTTAPIAPDPQSVARTPAVLVPLIRQEVLRGNKAEMASCRRVGLLLLEARSKMPPDEFTDYVSQADLSMSMRHARMCMRWAGGRP